MLVPEQAALQMELALLAMLAEKRPRTTPAPFHVGHGGPTLPSRGDLGGEGRAVSTGWTPVPQDAAPPGVVAAMARCEVLSFRRLARRILNETAGPTPAVLSPTGRQMALRHLILRRRKELQEFGKIAERPAFIAAIARGIAELLQECVSVEQLQTAADEAGAAGDPSAPRLHDTALLYRAYLDYLGSQRVDPEGVLDLARARLGAASWLDGAHLWIDGFAGLMQQQVRMIVALARRVVRTDVALLVDPARRRVRDANAEPDDLSLFARTERTWFMLARALYEAGVPIEEPVFLGADACPRFAGVEALARLERGLFAAPQRATAVPTEEPRPSGRAVPQSQEKCRDSRGAARHECRDSGDIAQEDCRGSGDACTPHADGRGVRLVTAPDHRTEAAAAVRTIVDLVQRPTAPLRYRDIAIIVRDLAPYHDLISACLRAHGIPFFIDRRRPTYHHPLVQAVRALLGMPTEANFGQTVTLLLKSGLSGLADEAADALENYVLAHGLTSADAWVQPWSYRAGSENDERRESAWQRRQLDAVNEARLRLRGLIGDWWPTATGKQGRPACRKLTERLFAVLQRLGVAERLADWCADATVRGDLDEAEEHQQVWADLTKLLDELVETLGDEQMTGRQFRDVLESGLADFTLGLVPATVDQVLVGSIERSRHPPVKAVFVLGFEDGQFPRRAAEETILGDAERARLESVRANLGRTSAQQLLDERMLAYVAVTRPSEFLWVSYAESDESGRRISPSPYLAALRAALPDVPVEKADASGPAAVSTIAELAGGVAANVRAWCEERPAAADRATWLALYDWARRAPISEAVARAMAALTSPPEARLSPAATAALWPPPWRTSVTRLERLAWCPFQHFADDGLRLEPRPVHEVSALDLGTLYHEILEQFVNELIETGAELRDLSPRQIAANLVRLGQIVVPAHAERVRMEEPQRRKAVWRSGAELRPAMAGQKTAIGRTPLKPVATEQVFGGGADDDLPALELSLSNGRTVLVRGKIDRVDAMPADDASLVVVLDYKRSSYWRLRLEQVYHGLALQLLAYLLVLREHGEKLTGAKIIPGGAFYLPLLGAFESLEHPQDADAETFNAYKCYRPRGVVDFDWIDSLEPGLTGRSSVFAVQRKKEGTIGNLEKSDAVEGGVLPKLLRHVQGKMVELAEKWLSGDIAVSPARLGKDLPCARCLYRRVCRYEYALRQSRLLEGLSRTGVLEQLAGNEP